METIKVIQISLVAIFIIAAIVNIIICIIDKETSGIFGWSCAVIWSINYLLEITL